MQETLVVLAAVAVLEAKEHDHNDVDKDLRGIAPEVVIQKVVPRM